MALVSIFKKLTLFTISSWNSLKYSTFYVIGIYSRKNQAALTAPKLVEKVQQYSTEDKIPVVQYEEIKKLPQHPEKLLIDVREPFELTETGQIPTSINIPLDQVEKELSSHINEKKFTAKYGREKPKTDTEIIFSCRLGSRSQKAAEMAKKLGYNNVRNYKGSWTEWAEKEGLSK